jgi:hypothetical protein
MRKNQPIAFPQPCHSEKIVIDGVTVKISFAGKQPVGTIQNIERILLQTNRFGLKKAHIQ